MDKEEYSILFKLIKQGKKYYEEDYDEQDEIYNQVWDNKFLKNEILNHLELYNKYYNKKQSFNVSELHLIQDYMNNVKVEFNDDDDQDKDKEDKEIKLNQFKIPKTISNLEINCSKTKLKQGDIPNSVTFLTFGSTFNQNLNIGIIPMSVKSLHFHRRSIFNKQLQKGQIPNSVTILHFNGVYNQQLKQGDIPNNIVEIHFGWAYDKPINPSILPISVKRITGSYNFKFDTLKSTGIKLF